MNLKVKFNETDYRAAADFGVFQVMQGAPGKDGFSPSIDITTINGGHRVSITDKNGTQEFDVMDGKDGEDASGGSGENGATFTPYVDSNGNLSWSNDKGLPNPQTVKIKPTRGTDYWTDADKAEIQSYVEDAILGGAW